MEREPKQARSVASMHRMLDAAESLLEVGGPDALTVEAVVRSSGGSTGSFYARFGDRQGLLIAMQDRFLDRLGHSLADAFESLPADGDLAQTVHRFVTEFLAAFRIHRSAFIAFMILNRSEPSMRQRGAVASRAGARAIAQLLEHHADQIAHPEPGLAADFAYRALFALATQTVMFDDREVSPHRYSSQTRENEAARLLLAYLQTPHSTPAEKTRPVE
jgi:AcrR family transcriptional regulator